MKITRAYPIGFCKGVNLAVQKVYEVIETYPHLPIYCIGQIVHNDIVNQDFVKKGVKILTVNKEEAIDSISQGVVIFSAHGTNPLLIQKAKEKNLIVIDTTCFYVKKEMQVILKYIKKQYDIIYIGKKNHPEAQAICSLSSHIYLIENLQDAKQLHLENKKIFLTNQTTISILDLKEIFEYFKKIYPSIIFGDELCSSTRLRQEAILSLNKNVDGIIIVGDKHSNNCTNLYLLAQKKKIPSIMISNEKELDMHWLKNKQHIVLFSGASTPLSLVQAVENTILEWQKEG